MIGLSKLSMKDSRIVNYTKDTGFPLNEVSRNTLLQVEDGRIYVGGNNGIAEFAPREIIAGQERLLPVVHVSSVNSLDSDEGADRVQYDNARSLEHVELSYKNAAVLIKYSPWIISFRKDINMLTGWRDLTRIGIILNVMKSFIRICQPGNILLYKACNSDGIWGMRQVSMSWFILLSGSPDGLK